MKSLLPAALIATGLVAWAAFADEPRTPETSLKTEIREQSLFAAGPQISLDSLRKENLELKARVAELTSRLETLERRLSQVERGGGLVLTSLEFPEADTGRSQLHVPLKLERGMQMDPAGRMQLKFHHFLTPTPLGAAH